MATPKSNSYLAKLINLLIKKEGGVIKIPVIELVDDDLGQGFQVHFDTVNKELVLTHVPPGSKVYLIEESATWLTSDVMPQSPSRLQSQSPLSREDLIAAAWTEGGVTRTVAEVSQPPKNRVVQLSSEGQAEAERVRKQASLMKELETLQPPSPSPQPPYRERTAATHSRQQTVFSKP